MASVTALKTPPAARDVSPWVRFVIGGVLFGAAAIFLLALRHPRTGPTLKDLSSTGDKWWTREARPTPAPTPHVQHVTATKPIIVQAPLMPNPTPTPCQICIERLQRYQRAIETGMGSGSTTVRQMPPSPVAQPTPSPLVFREQ
jgi:hypothetical protein